MSARVSTALVAVAAVLVTSGCGALSQGADAAEEFTEHFTSTHPDHVIDTITNATDELPFTGKVSGTLVLADDTPPEVLDALLTEVEEWRPDTSAAYTPMGVQAGGLGICLDDPQREAKRELRTALYAEGLVLDGEWACAPWRTSTEPVYRGSLTDLVADTERVDSVLPADHDLVLTAEVSDPWGTVTTRWTGLPDTLADTLEAVAQLHPVAGFRLEGDVLAVNVGEDADLTEARTVAGQAAGPDLEVQVLRGSLDADEAAANEALLPVVQSLREVPGVDTASAARGTLEVTTQDPAALRPIYDAVLDHPDFPEGGSLRLRVVDAGETSPVEGSSYSTSVGDAHLDMFAGLVALDTVQDARLLEPVPGQPAAMHVTLTGAFPEGIASLKPVLLDGTAVTVHAPDSLQRVELTVARTLTEDHVSTMFTDPDVAAIRKAWNDAPAAAGAGGWSPGRTHGTMVG